MSKQRSPEAARIPELHFEPGHHTMRTERSEEIVAGIQDGNVYANDWNEAVSTRMKRYGPSLLAIDNLEPFGLEGDDLAPDMKLLVWATLPDPPDRVNGTDHYYVLMGDNSYNSGNPNTLSNYAIPALGLGVGVLISRGVQAVQAGLSRSEKATAIGKPEKAVMPVMPRRKFAAWVLGGLGAGAVLQTKSGLNLGYKLATYATRPSVQGVGEGIARFTESVDVDRSLDRTLEVCIDGRTALLIAKAHDAMSELDLFDNNIAAVVIGNGHIPFAEELITNARKRAAFIGRHTRVLYEAAEEGVPFFVDEDAATTADMRIEGITARQISSYIVRIDQPDPKRFAEDPQKEIERVVTLVAQFNSPSIQAVIGNL